MKKIIKELSKIGQEYFGISFHFKSKANFFVAKSSNTSLATNKRKNSRNEVKVIKWFDDLWAYIEIRYIPKFKERKTVTNIFFSLSVFQGQASDDTKLQLLRAEWDNYDETSNKHSQPHWHVYSLKDYFISDDFKEVVKSEENPFIQFIQDGSNKIIDTDRLHFAMNGQWSENKTDVHTISTESDLINWFKGLLNHLRSELKYVKEKRD